MTTVPTATSVVASTESEYLGPYEITDDQTGNRTFVEIEDGIRTIRTNAVPNHSVGRFPSRENPYALKGSDRTWTMPLSAVWTGSQTPTLISGIALNGVKFEPGTGGYVECDSGERYQVEANGGSFDLGLDFNNAHLDPNGEYHYHGVSFLLVDKYDTADDLALIGFAPDGYLIYFSKSGAYRSGYKLSVKPRTGSGCDYTINGGKVGSLGGTAPDGTYTSDFVWEASNGDLDECNGTTIDGQYAYLITESFPFVGRCLNGEFDTAQYGEGSTNGDDPHASNDG